MMVMELTWIGVSMIAAALVLIVIVVILEIMHEKQWSRYLEEYAPGWRDHDELPRP